ncbi:acyl-coa n-acyltransferase [Trichococcus palustris]|uniref:Acyl-coa n-acyltransferase n=1 Tax=Trichococcus palustris TaxID=140314 RepID=A0A143YYJ9_9LACT|nr:GNAT family N-acetyltransferase [Trichococcus palustris]CZR00666.1 acyl-coa n-acyltransferase [Trichococcus palustris]SFK89894.1 ElaA protein [Trichococcus palustris]
MWTIKPFGELTLQELHRIYKERTAVFVVEQDCAYQEVDDADFASIHFCKQVDDTFLAYARLILEPESVRIGRVMVPKEQRANGFGDELLTVVLAYANKHYPGFPIHAQAQAYLQSFYTSFGFRPISEIYLEDDIPHIDMVMDPPKN